MSEMEDYGEDDVGMDEINAQLDKLYLKLETARSDGDKKKVANTLKKIDDFREGEEKTLDDKLAKFTRKLEKAEKDKDDARVEKMKGKIARANAKKSFIHCGAGTWHDIDVSAEGAVRFASLPVDQFRFVESTAYNASYDNDFAYVPVQHNDETCHVYKLDVEHGTEPEYVAEVLLLSEFHDDDGHDELTPFGCALSKQGILWICMFNVNTVVGFDLATLTTIAQVDCPAPNDVCINDDGSRILMGCGSRLGKVVLGGGAGTIWSAPTTEPFKAEQIYEKAQGTMAGIEEKDGVVYCTHLERMSAYRCDEHTALRVWTGFDPEDGLWYLADNLAWWTSNALITPCYRTLAGPVGEFLDENPSASAFAWGGARAMTFLKRLGEGGMSGVCKANELSNNPECDLSLSKGDVFPNVHLSVYDVAKHKTTNFRVNCEQFEDFDGHVTHAQPAKGHLILVNFQFHKLMIIKDEAFGKLKPTEPEEA